MDKVIGPYVIGGAIAATFYLEPTQTFDLDIFISCGEDTSQIVNLGPIYEYLGKRGYQFKEQHISMEGWDVELLPADDKLYSEALVQKQSTQAYYVCDETGISDGHCASNRAAKGFHTAQSIH